MLYFQNPSDDPYYNAAFEEYLFTHFAGEEIFLLWRNRPAVVFGCYQNLFAEVCYPAVKKMGIAVVRRPSGGGTVYHDAGNFNYTLIRPSGAEKKNDYESFLAPMITALRRLGVPAERGRLCDIAIDGKKVSGSAQKAAGGNLLHHGTLLYDTDLSVLHAVTERHNGGTFETKGIRSAPWPVTNIRASLGQDAPDADTFAARLTEAFLPPDAVRASLSADALWEIGRMAAEKYASWEWTFGHTPAFTYRNRISLGGDCAEIEIVYTAQKGSITEFRYMSADGMRQIPEFVGCRLALEELREICGRLWDDPDAADDLL